MTNYELPHIFINAWNRVVHDQQMTREEVIDLKELTKVTPSADDERFLNDLEQVVVQPPPTNGDRSALDILLDAGEREGLNIAPFQADLTAGSTTIERKTPPPLPPKKFQLTNFAIGYSQGEFDRTFQGIRVQLHGRFTNTQWFDFEPTFRAHTTLAKNGQDLMAELGVTTTLNFYLLPKIFSMYGGLTALGTLPQGYVISPVTGITFLRFYGEATLPSLAGSGWQKEHGYFIGWIFKI